MRGCNINYCLWPIILTLSLFLLSCASFGPTKPNPVFQGSYPDKYYDLAEKNPLLAKELGKLPEMQNGISDSEVSALEKIVGLYNSDPATFNSAFQQMYGVGLPDVRKYCSPLQALFWLAEDGKLSKEFNHMDDYSLESLLFKAWKFEDNFLMLSKHEAKKVINSIKDEDEKKDYLSFTNMETINHLILFAYKRNPSMFSKEAREIIKNSIVENVRWKDFHTVTNRLNAPELLDYYINENFGYYLSSTSAKQTPEQTFKYREGSCSSLAKFGNSALKRAGFKTRYRRVDFVQDGHTGLVIILNDASFFVAVDFGPWGNRMGGPYRKISDIDNQLAKSKRITNSHWGLPTYAW